MDDTQGSIIESIYAEVSARDLPPETDCFPPVDKQFAPLDVSPSKAVAGCIPRLGIVRITLPNGVSIALDGSSVEELMILTGGSLSGSHVLAHGQMQVPYLYGCGIHEQWDTWSDQQGHVLGRDVTDVGRLFRIHLP